MGAVSRPPLSVSSMLWTIYWSSSCQARLTNPNCMFHYLKNAVRHLVDCSKEGLVWGSAIFTHLHRCTVDSVGTGGLIPGLFLSLAFDGIFANFSEPLHRSPLVLVPAEVTEVGVPYTLNELHCKASIWFRIQLGVLSSKTHEPLLKVDRMVPDQLTIPLLALKEHALQLPDRDFVTVQFS